MKPLNYIGFGFYFTLGVFLALVLAYLSFSVGIGLAEYFLSDSLIDQGFKAKNPKMWM